jgi:colanic acid/amylovoran biosynthesis protein
MPIREALRLSVFSAIRGLDVDVHFVLGQLGSRIIDAYEKADLIVSAPGGPYFGDIYANHEIVHWFYVWLGHVYKKPVVLYAPSVGPFKNRWLNPIRKYFFKKFDVLCVRESISKRYLQSLLGPIPVEVTADSALQSNVVPKKRTSYFESIGLPERTNCYLVAVSLNDYGYPGESNPDLLKTQYEQCVRKAVHRIAEKRDAHFLLIPQLYGSVHSDAEYLERIGKSFGETVSWEVVDDTLNSDEQRQLFAMSDIHIASRYHPAIFGHGASVPGICIYYEHKALGFMEKLGLERFAFDIRKLNCEDILAKVDDLLNHRDELSIALTEKIPSLQETARRTTALCASVISDD